MRLSQRKTTTQLYGEHIATIMQDSQCLTCCLHRTKIWKFKRCLKPPLTWKLHGNVSLLYKTGLSAKQSLTNMGPIMGVGSSKVRIDKRWRVLQTPFESQTCQRNLIVLAHMLCSPHTHCEMTMGYVIITSIRHQYPVPMLSHRNLTRRPTVPFQYGIRYLHSAKRIKEAFRMHV